MAEAQETQGFAWYYAMPIVNNRFFWWDMMKVCVIAPTITVLIGVVIFLMDPTYDPPSLWIVAIPYVALFALVLIAIPIVVLIYRNRYGSMFRIDNDGVSWAVGSKEQAVGHGLIALSLLTGSAGAVGSSLIAESQSTGEIPWSNVRRANYHAGPRVISIRNSWRVVTRLYCRAEDWDAVKQWVEWGVAEGARRRAGSGRVGPTPPSRSPRGPG